MSRQTDGVTRCYADGSDAAAVKAGYDWLLSFARENRLSSATIFLNRVSSIPQLAEGLLDRLDRWRVPAICAIPWGDSIPCWKARWRPTDIRTGRPAPDPGEAVSNPVVVKGLQSLTGLANLANGVDTYNRTTAVQVFLSLQRSGEAFDPDEVLAWCARNGWGAANAVQLATLARNVAAGKRVVRGQWRLRPDIVAAWREEARVGGLSN